METPKTNYSRSEWSALSIQERIRAMNDSLETVEQLPSTLINFSAEDDSTTVDTRFSYQESCTDGSSSVADPNLPARTSVVDMWRKRESCASPKESRKSAIPLPRPSTTPKREWRKTDSSDGHEEKKEDESAMEEHEKATPRHSAQAIWGQRGFAESRPRGSTPASRPIDVVHSENGQEVGREPAPFFEAPPKKRWGRLNEASKPVDMTILPPPLEEDYVTAVDPASSAREKACRSPLWARRGLERAHSPTVSLNEPSQVGQEATEQASLQSTPAPQRTCVMDFWKQRANDTSPPAAVPLISPSATPPQVHTSWSTLDHSNEQEKVADAISKASHHQPSPVAATPQRSPFSDSISKRTRRTWRTVSTTAAHTPARTWASPKNAPPPLAREKEQVEGQEALIVDELKEIVDVFDETKDSFKDGALCHSPQRSTMSRESRGPFVAALMRREPPAEEADEEEEKSVRTTRTAEFQYTPKRLETFSHQKRVEHVADLLSFVKRETGDVPVCIGPAIDSRADSKASSVALTPKRVNMIERWTKQINSSVQAPLAVSEEVESTEGRPVTQACDRLASSGCSVSSASSVARYRSGLRSTVPSSGTPVHSLATLAHLSMGNMASAKDSVAPTPLNWRHTPSRPRPLPPSATVGSSHDSRQRCYIPKQLQSYQKPVDIVLSNDSVAIDEASSVITPSRGKVAERFLRRINGANSSPVEVDDSVSLPAVSAPCVQGEPETLKSDSSCGEFQSGDIIPSTPLRSILRSPRWQDGRATPASPIFHPKSKISVSEQCKLKTGGILSDEPCQTEKDSVSPGQIESTSLLVDTLANRRKKERIKVDARQNLLLPSGSPQAIAQKASTSDSSIADFSSRIGLAGQTLRKNWQRANASPVSRLPSFETDRDDDISNPAQNDIMSVSSEGQQPSKYSVAKKKWVKSDNAGPSDDDNASQCDASSIASEGRKRVNVLDQWKQQMIEKGLAESKISVGVLPSNSRIDRGKEKISSILDFSDDQRSDLCGDDISLVQLHVSPTVGDCAENASEAAASYCSEIKMATSIASTVKSSVTSPRLVHRDFEQNADREAEERSDTSGPSKILTTWTARDTVATPRTIVTPKSSNATKRSFSEGSKFSRTEFGTPAESAAFSQPVLFSNSSAFDAWAYANEVLEMLPKSERSRKKDLLKVGKKHLSTKLEDKVVSSKDDDNFLQINTSFRTSSTSSISTRLPGQNGIRCSDETNSRADDSTPIVSHCANKVGLQNRHGEVGYDSFPSCEATPSASSASVGTKQKKNSHFGVGVRTEHEHAGPGEKNERLRSPQSGVLNIYQEIPIEQSVSITSSADVSEGYSPDERLRAARRLIAKKKQLQQARRLHKLRIQISSSLESLSDNLSPAASQFDSVESIDSYAVPYTPSPLIQARVMATEQKEQPLDVCAAKTAVARCFSSPRSRKEKLAPRAPRVLSPREADSDVSVASRTSGPFAEKAIQRRKQLLDRAAASPRSTTPKEDLYLARNVAQAMLGISTDYQKKGRKDKMNRLGSTALTPQSTNSTRPPAPRRSLSDDEKLLNSILGQPKSPKSDAPRLSSKYSLSSRFMEDNTADRVSPRIMSDTTAQGGSSRTSSTVVSPQHDANPSNLSPRNPDDSYSTRSADSSDYGTIASATTGSANEVPGGSIQDQSVDRTIFSESVATTDNPRDLIAEEFCTQSSKQFEAFKRACTKMSFGLIAADWAGETISAVDFQNIGGGINERKVLPNKNSKPHKSSFDSPLASPVQSPQGWRSDDSAAFDEEDIAIEVEYMDDDDDPATDLGLCAPIDDAIQWTTSSSKMDWTKPCAALPPAGEPSCELPRNYADAKRTGLV